MLVTICERLSDVRGDTDAAHGRLVVSLDPADGSTRDLGYASVRVAKPGGAARFDGVAVVLPGGFAPDPIQILVVDGPVQASGVAVVDRGDLPAVVRVDQLGRTARVLRRRVGRAPAAVPPPPAALAEAVARAADDAIEGRRASGESTSALPEWEE